MKRLRKVTIICTFGQQWHRPFLHHISSLMQKIKTVFIVNPISGTLRPAHKRKLIERFTDSELFDYKIIFTECAGHAVSLAAESVRDGAELVVAVGGDGTVNEVGRGLAHTGTVMGIIPCGSGNGLARHLGIPVNPILSFRWLNGIRVADTDDSDAGGLGNSCIDMDYGVMSGHPFFATCGVGFDAVVSQKFADGKGRGTLKYVENVLHELRSYKDETYDMLIDGESIDMEAFLITCANANQWGNNAFIAPEASVCDGLLDITAIPRFSAAEVPVLAAQLMTGHLNHNTRLFHRKCHELVIRMKDGCVAHYDGEPLHLDGDVVIRIEPGGIRMAVPSGKPHS